MGCLKAYDEDDKEVEFNTLNYYKSLIEKSLNLGTYYNLIEEDSKKTFNNLIEEDKEKSFYKDIQFKYMRYLLFFWGNFKENDIYKLDKDKVISNLINLGNHIKWYKFSKNDNTLKQLVDELSDEELSYIWKEEKEEKKYKIISVFNIYQQFFVKYDDNRPKKTRSLDKTNIENKSPNIFPPMFLFEYKDAFYLLINTKAPLLYFSVADSYTHKSTDFSYYFEENGKLITYKSQLKIKFKKSSGGYMGRPDSMDEIDYKWKINSSLNPEDKKIAKLLAFYIGLENDKEINNIPNGYYKTNTPTSYSKTKTKIDSLKIFFEFFKKIKTDDKRNFPKTNIRKPLVFDNIASYISSNRSDNMIDEEHYTSDIYKILYKSKNKGKQISSKSENRKTPAKIMANTLYEFSFFKDIKEIDYIGDEEPKKTKLTNSSFSATSFAQYVLCKNDIANKTWESLYFKNSNTYKNEKKESYLKSTKKSKIDTEQEWCHLLGHADGGKDEFRNLVSGSKHCNTEQLAMEIGQSRFINATGVEIKANITAYLIKSNFITKDITYSKSYIQGELKDELFNKFMEKDIFKKLFMKSDDKYVIVRSDNYEEDLNKIYDVLKEEIDSLAGKIKLLKVDDIEEEIEKDIKNIKVFKENLAEKFFETLPLAKNMRYKHYYNGKKIFDHIFDAQNESICTLECKILDYTLEANLYLGTSRWNEYKKNLIKRVKNKLPEEDDDEIFSDNKEKINEKNTSIKLTNKKKKQEKQQEKQQEKINNLKKNIENIESKLENKLIDKLKWEEEIRSIIDSFDNSVEEE